MKTMLHAGSRLRSIPPFLLFLTVLALPSVSSAEESRAPAGPAATPVIEAEHPLTAAIDTRRAALVERLEELETLRRAAFGPDAVLAISREIARAKLDFEIGVLTLQRGEQEALGRRPAVEELTTAIAALQKLREEIADWADATPVPVSERAGEDR